MRRASALLLFVLGESVLASLSFGVAAIPAFLTFFAGSALLLRGSPTWPTWHRSRHSGDARAFALLTGERVPLTKARVADLLEIPEDEFVARDENDCALA